MGTKCCVLNSVNGSGVVTRTRTAASRREAAVPVDERALEAQAVAGRASDQRDVAEALLQGVRELLLVPERPSTSRKAKVFCAVAVGSVVRSRRRRSRANATPSGMLKAAAGRRDGRSTAVQTSAAKLTPVTLWSRQPSGPISPAVVQPTTGTPAKRRAHLRRQRVAVVLAGAEEEHERDARAAGGRRAAPATAARGPVRTIARCGWSARRPQAVPSRPAHGGGPCLSRRGAAVSVRVHAHDTGVRRARATKRPRACTLGRSARPAQPCRAFGRQAAAAGPASITSHPDRENPPCTPPPRSAISPSSPTSTTARRR